MVSNETNRITYDISGQSPLESGYEIPFFFEDASWVEVYLTGSRTDNRVDSSDYTIDESTETPRVKFKTGYSFPEGMNILSIRRRLPILQYLDLRDGDTIHAEELEKALDRITRICIMINDTLGRALLVSVADTGDQIIVPVPEERAGSLLGFDDSGKPLPVLQSDIEQKLNEALRAEENTIALEQSTQTALGAAEKARDESQSARDESKKARDEAEGFKKQSEDSASAASKSEMNAGAARDKAEAYKNAAADSWDSVRASHIDINARHEDIILRHEDITKKYEIIEEDRKVVEADVAEVTKAIEKAWQHANTASTAASNVLIYTKKAIESAKLAKSILSQIRTSETNVNEMEKAVSDLLVEARKIVVSTSEMLESASSYAAQAKASESQASIYKDASASNANASSQHKDTALSYKQGAESILAEVKSLQEKFEAIASQAVAEQFIALDGKTYRRSVYSKNGRPYSTLVEV